MPVFAEVVDELLNLGDVLDNPPARGGGQPPIVEHGIRLALAGHLEAATRAQTMDEHPQRATRGDSWVLLAQRTGGRVARVGERWPPSRHEARVELFEGRDREEHLAAHLDHLRHRRLGGRGEHGRYAVDRPHVERHVFAGAPVTTGERPSEPTTLVEEVDRQSVDLELAQEPVCRRALPTRIPRHPRRPRRKLLGREGVVQAEHPLEVVDGLEVRREGGGPHLLGRAIRGSQRGMARFERGELADQRVIFTVGDRGCVLHVIGELVPPDRLGEVGPRVPDGRRHIGSDRADVGRAGGQVACAGHRRHPAVCRRHRPRVGRDLHIIGWGPDTGDCL